MIDVSQARAATPGCVDRIHLNNAGAALMSQGVLDTVVEHLRLESRLGGYEAARATEERFEAVYSSVAQLIGSAPDEIAIVDNATAAWHLAFASIPLTAGDTILTAEAEYATNFIMYLKVARERGVEVKVVPSDGSGQLDVSALEAAIDDRTRLISVSHVPTNGGLVNPAGEIGAVARDAGIPYLLDACQSVGQLVVDVEEIGCDFLAATGRKFLRGPRGTGFLYARRAMLDRVEPPLIDMHGAEWVEADRYELRPDARRFENWEFNLAALVGLGEAVAYAREWGLEAIGARVDALAEALRERLGEVAGVTVHDLGERRCAIVTFTHAEVDADEARRRLGEQGFNVSVSQAPATLLDFDHRQLPPLVRASVHYYNTDDELDRFAAAVAAL